MRKMDFYKRASIITAFLALALSVWSAPSFAFSGIGSGTLEDPYIITDVTQLQEMQDDLDAFYNLGNDIDASGFSFNPVGPFSGTFNGMKHKITGLTINKATATNVGLFSTIKKSTVIKNVGLVDVYVRGKSKVGALVGYTDVAYTEPVAVIRDCYATSESDRGVRGTGGSAVGGLVGYTQFTDITCCHTDITVISTNNDVGGLVGWVNGARPTVTKGVISECYSKGTVSGEYGVGGLVGWIRDASIEKSYSVADVTGQGGWNTGVGGLAGDMYQAVSITDCYARGSVSGYQAIGGLVGWASGGSATWDRGEITNCYATGHITADYDPGGILASIDPDEEYMVMIRNCFWDKQTTGVSAVTYCGTPKTTLQMKNIVTYTDLDTDGLFNEAWDFVGNPNDDDANEDIWDIDSEGAYNDGYPYNIAVFDISGYVRHGDGTGINGATVTVKDDMDIVVATLTTETHNEIDGWYIAKNLERGTYTLEAAFEDCPFNPAEIALSGGDRTDVDFYTYIISGEVTRYAPGGTGAGVESITVNATKEGETAPYKTTTTGPDGSYRLKVPGGTFEVEATNP